VFDRRGHVAKLCIVFFPLLVASMIAVSRVDDYWHHWQDVCAGGLIGMLKTGFSLMIYNINIPFSRHFYTRFFAGLTIASFCYLQFFPPPYDKDGMSMNLFFQTFIICFYCIVG